ncbi:hypothetical protein Poly30_52630 [Planctomycetes bacterium Poly30]|uniref:Carboxypeptidase regulatory-like domain-containing protein n=1 Tax=Saltatorellus ferox TaxID=2528018 RepID=A0A518F039_9BACT|nr:hypothetical protein Poly30_52630 [Planctomycetes bacterium Poly30]
MRYLFLCAVLIVSCAALFVFRDSSGFSGGLQAAVRPAVERATERGSPGLAGVSVAGGTEAQRRQAPTEEVEAMVGDASTSTPSRIEVRVMGDEEPLDSTMFQGLRIQARSLLTGERLEVPATTMAGGGEFGATIESPSGGRFRVLIDPSTVPEGYVASGAHPLGPLDTSGIAASFVQVADGESVEVTLRVFRIRSLSGWVSSAEGEGLGGITVRAQGIAPGMSGLSHDVVTALDGAFEFEKLLPEVYGISVIDAGVHAEALSSLPRPPRQLFDLRHGPCSGVEVRLGPGPITISGRVVDERGEPFADVSVLAYYAGDETHGVALEFERAFNWSDHALRVRSDGEGRFRIPGLRGVPIRVQVGAEEAANGEGRRARFVPAPVEVPLGERSRGTVVVGPLVLERSRRFVARGRIVLGAEELGGVRLKHGRLRVVGVPYAEVTLAHGLPGQETRPLVQFDRRSGELTVSCESTRGSCAFTVELQGHPDTRKEFTLFPATSGSALPEVDDRSWMFP